MISAARILRGEMTAPTGASLDYQTQKALCFDLLPIVTHPTVSSTEIENFAKFIHFYVATDLQIKLLSIFWRMNGFLTADAEKTIGGWVLSQSRVDTLA